MVLIMAVCYMTQSIYVVAAAVVGMALEVLVHIPLSGWPGMELASQLVSNSIR